MPSRGKSVTVDNSFIEWLDRFIDLTAIGSRRAALNAIRAKWGDVILEEAKPIPVDALNNRSQRTTVNSHLTTNHSQSTSLKPKSTTNDGQLTVNSPQENDKRLANLQSGLGALDRL